MTAERDIEQLLRDVVAIFGPISDYAWKRLRLAVSLGAVVTDDWTEFKTFVLGRALKIKETTE